MAQVGDGREPEHTEEDDDSALPKVDLTHVPAQDQSGVRRYEVLDLLGSGGMGEVHLCKDSRIGREIAMKVIHPKRGMGPEYRGRFLREALLQGQLEHPSVVPVYDLGVDPTGSVYFTMKRIRGMTLESILSALRKKDPEAEEKFPRRRLLSVFSSVCLAIDFAHERGVVHRDLKPANIMVGDYGEVYVLDWGLAKIIGSDHEPGPAGKMAAATHFESGERTPVTHVVTAAGQIMGTAGYIAPERVTGELLEPDPRSDVYSLGAIFYEILTLERFIRKQSEQAMLLAALVNVDIVDAIQSSSGNVPLELASVCSKALSLELNTRFTSARELHDALDQYLSGDRDRELRQKMADSHAEAAEQAASRAAEQAWDAREQRSRAMGDVSRALALDPNNARAMRTMVQMLMEPPSWLPEDVRTELLDIDQHQIRVASIAGALSYASWLLYLPLCFWMGVLDWTLVGASFGFVALASVLLIFNSRLGTPSSPIRYLAMVTSTLGFALSARLFGPFVVLPGLIAVNTLGYAMHRGPKQRFLVLALGCSAVVVPALLEWTSILEPSYIFENGRMTLLPHAVAFVSHPALLFLLLSTLSVIVTSCYYIGRLRDELVEAQRRLHLQSWHLQQLIPQQAREVVRSNPPPPR